MTSIIIRQPGYLPYLGIFKKIQSCDIYVHLDDVQYSIRGGDNRNKIRTHNGTMWLSVPLKNPFGKMLNEVQISNDSDWSTHHKNSIKANYGKAPYFKQYWDDIEHILSKKWNKLIDINLEFIKYFCSVLDIRTKTILSSELDVSSIKSERLLEICKKLNATTYISGELGKNYLDENLFNTNGIKVIYEKFQHPVYHQLHGEFISYLSIIDLLFNEGDESKTILSSATNL